MRTSPLRQTLAARGATFRTRYGVEVVASMGDWKAEYAAVRDAVALTDFSFMHKYRVSEAQGIDWLEPLVAGNVAKIRFGRLLHTFLADAEGFLIADAYVANNDDELFFLCESIVPDADLERALGAPGCPAENLTDSHVMLSLDGFRAWEVARDLFGADVLGLPYLSIETYPFEGGSVRLFRAGKTSEFGYLLMAPAEISEALFRRVFEGVEKCGGRICGVDVHDSLRLEGRFFNIHAEGLRVRDPLPIGLQWMIDFDKGSFSGAGPIRARRESGLRQKVVGVSAEPSGGDLGSGHLGSGDLGSGDLRTGNLRTGDLRWGARVYHEDREIGEVVAQGFSCVLGRPLGLAVLPIELAYAGLEFRLGSPSGSVVHTISMPPIMPRSLRVKLDEV